MEIKVDKEFESLIPPLSNDELKQLEKKHLMGFKDFFELFNINVTKKDFFNMLQRVWVEEVEAYF